MIPTIPPIRDNLGTEVVATVPSLHAGRLYRFAGLAGPTNNGTPVWSVPPGNYRLIGVSHNVRTWQNNVVYMGVGGYEEGELYTATLSDWVDLFTLIGPEPTPPEQPPAPLPALVERRAGYKPLPEHGRACCGP